MKTVRITTLIDRLEDEGILRLDRSTHTIYKYDEETHAYLFDTRYMSGELYQTIANKYAWEVLKDDEGIAQCYKDESIGYAAWKDEQTYHAEYDY